jgi:hypothetical protein
LFEPFAKVTKLYPQKTASEVESQWNCVQLARV